MFQVLVTYHQLLLQGFLTTLKLLGCIILIGIPLGTFLGVMGGRYSLELGKIIKGARFITKVIPVLVLLFWLHYPLQGLLGVVIDPFWTTVIALGLINTIAVASIVLTELQLLPKSYKEAGITLGMSSKQIIKHIELPLLMRRMLPQLLLVQASMLEYTLFASLISVPELFKTAQAINAMIYQPVAIYSLLVLFFLIILAPFHLFISWVQKKYTTNYA
ncbi:MAG: ABC transporter permease subunit [Candidatus Pacebacteria bacterium]|nr:ABC transporter permease subunit [Candidatus Paceibacterota bacterium]